jgi:hypothetical protein
LRWSSADVSPSGLRAEEFTVYRDNISNREMVWQIAATFR